MLVTPSKYAISKFIKYWIPAIIYAIVIFYFSSLNGQDLPEFFPSQSILAHLIEFAVFALLIGRAVKGYWRDLPYPRRFSWVIVISLILALSDEWHQAFVAGRDACGFDFFLDAVGSLIGALLYR